MDGIISNRTERSSGGHHRTSGGSNGHHRSSGNRRPSHPSLHSNSGRKGSGSKGGGVGGHHSGDELLDNKDEVIQVEILPQDDDKWGESTTCVTGNTSERSASYDDVRRALKDQGNTAPSWHDSNSIFKRMRCARFFAVSMAALIFAVAFLSPVVMVTLPKLAFVLPSAVIANVSPAVTVTPSRYPSSLLPDVLLSNNRSFLPNPPSVGSVNNNVWTTTSCTPDCEGLLINFATKLFILLIGICALFVRRFTETLPRLYLSKWLILAFIFLITFAYWLFYGVRIMQKREADYTVIVNFALSLVDTLLFVHYLAFIVFEIRGLKSEYRIRVVRSPDGESRTFECGLLSVQRAAVVVLRHYYADFNVYNPYLERLPSSSTSRMRKGGGSNTGSSHQQPVSSFKVYDLDLGGVGSVSSGGGGAQPSVNDTHAIIAAAARKRDSGHNERFYEEIEWERRVKKRKARLITAAEEAFAHVKRLHEEKGPCVPMDSHEAAQAVFPSLARSLQKYLRITRQQPRHTAEQVIRYLAQCLTFDMSPKAFLERFFNTQETHEASQDSTKWSIVCEKLVSRNIDHGTVFQLRCHCPGPDAGVYLLCTVSRLPFFDMTEEPFDPKHDKFVLRLNSETSV